MAYLVYRMDAITFEKYFKALANRIRIRLLFYLNKNGEQQLDRIVETLGLPYKTVFRNLSILRKIGFIESRIYKSQAYFKVSKKLTEYEEHLLKLICSMQKL